MNDKIEVKPLLEKAMLARVSLSFTHLRRKDKKVTNETALRHGVDPGKAGQYIKFLVPHDEIKPLQTLAGAVRGWHVTNTLPWDDSKNRLLPSANYERYVDGYRERREAFLTAARKFVEETYPRLRAQAPSVLNGLYCAEDYPPVEQLRQRFGCDSHFSQIPESGDFRVDILDDEAIGEIRAKIDMQVHASFERAMRGAWERLHDVVKKMRDRLRDVDTSFHASLLNNIAEVCDILPALNFTGSQELEAMRKKVLGLCSFDREQLLDSEPLRLTAADRADRILSDMEVFTGVSFTEEMSDDD